MYTNLHSLTQSLRVPCPGGIGGIGVCVFTRGGSARRFKHTFNILIFTKMVPLSYILRISQNYIISYNCHVFLGLLVVLISWSKGASFYMSFLPKFATFLATIPSILQPIF